LRGGDFGVRVSARGLSIVLGDQRVDVPATLRSRRWHRLAVSIGERIDVRCECAPKGSGERPVVWSASGAPRSGTRFPDATWELAREAPGRGHFNGRIEAPRIYGEALGAQQLLDELNVPRPAHPALLAAWDFSQCIDGERLVDVSGHGRDGRTMQMPTRAVTSTPRFTFTTTTWWTRSGVRAFAGECRTNWHPVCTP
jgi:hypothetical protein